MVGKTAGRRQSALNSPYGLDTRDLKNIGSLGFGKSSLILLTGAKQDLAECLGKGLDRFCGALVALASVLGDEVKRACAELKLLLTPNRRTPK